MKKEAQRIAIAEVLGYTKLRHCTCSEDKTSGWKDGKRITHILDFTRDLDAMHEAEKVLDWDQRDKYTRFLHQLKTLNPPLCSGSAGWMGYEAEWAIAHATADQRCEAFLRAIGKWQEAEEEEPEPEADRPLRLDADRIEYEERRSREANEAP